MDVPISTAKAQLTDLVRRAENGGEVVLTRRGQPVVRLVPIARKPDRATKAALIAAIRVGGSEAVPGPPAARSQGFLYDEDGLPE